MGMFVWKFIDVFLLLLCQLPYTFVYRKSETICVRAYKKKKRKSIFHRKGNRFFFCDAQCFVFESIYVSFGEGNEIGFFFFSFTCSMRLLCIQNGVSFFLHAFKVNQRLSVICMCTACLNYKLNWSYTKT